MRSSQEILDQITKSKGFKYLQILAKHVPPNTNRMADWMLSRKPGLSLVDPTNSNLSYSNYTSFNPPPPDPMNPNLPFITDFNKHPAIMSVLYSSNITGIQELADQIIKDLAQLPNVEDLIDKAKLTLAIPNWDNHAKYVATFLLTGKVASDFTTELYVELDRLLYDGIDAFKREIDLKLAGDISKVNSALASLLGRPTSSRFNSEYDKLEYFLSKADLQFVKEYFVKSATKEYQFANSLLSDIVKLPGAKYLIKFMESPLSDIPTKVKDLFNWALTGKYKLGTLKFFSDNYYKWNVERIINIIINYTKKDSKIFEPFMTSEVINTIKLINALHNVAGSTDAFIDTFDTAYNFANFWLTGEYHSGIDEFYVKLVMDPDKLSDHIKNLLGNPDPESILVCLEDELYADVMIPDLPKNERISYVLTTMQRLYPKFVEDLQIIFDFVNKKPEAPDPPSI